MADIMKTGDMQAGNLTCEDIMKRVFGHDMMDEIEVANKYLDYAVTIDNEGKDCIAKKFAEMGYEEYTHAHVQRDILVDEGYMLPKDVAMAFDQLKHRVHTLFRKWVW